MKNGVNFRTCDQNQSEELRPRYSNKHENWLPESKLWLLSFVLAGAGSKSQPIGT